MKPGFIVLTFPKTASTSLFETLNRHPDICLPLNKESWYFTTAYHKGEAWYEERFWHCGRQKQTPVVGEVNTGAMLKDEYLDRVKETVPEAKIIIILRDPLKRTVSHYYHLIRMGEETRGIEEALSDPGKEILEKEFEYVYKFGYTSFSLRYKSAVQKVLQLYNPQKVKFFLFEDLLKQPREVLRDLQDFVGVSPMELRLVRANVARMPGRGWFHRLARLPSFLYHGIARSPVLERLVPMRLKRRSRVLRKKLAGSLAAFSEAGSRPFVPPPLPETVRNSLENLFRQTLAGLDVITGLPLHEYWDWYPE